MVTISADLIQRLRDVLTRCSALDSDRALRAVFVDERLALWINRVPENTPDRATRVALLIVAFCDKTNAQGDNALILLLRVLAEQTPPDDALHNDLNQLTDEFSVYPPADLVTLTSSTSKSVPFMVDDLPRDFVPRPVEFNALRDALLAEGRDAPVAITAALRGAGGYGKTILARALCHELRAEFPDGVLWVTLGETPDIIGGAIKLYDALTGERPAFVDTEDAAQKLAEALGEKRCLLVVDDVWNAAHLRPFLRGGPGCTRLITTRNRDTLPADVHPVDVDAMRTDEAVALLGMGLPVVETETQDLASLPALTGRLGEWPLLLGLVNGALRVRVELGQSLDDALAWVNRALDKRGLTAFDARDAEARDQAVALTLGVSLWLLDVEQRARYNELAVFPEDIDVPLAALTVLWGATGGLDDFDVEELYQQLANLSLVQHFDLKARVLRLHDVVRAYLVSQQTDFPALHAQLVDAYAVQCNHNAQGVVAWDTGPDDGYFYLYLPYHLAQAGRVADLDALLLSFDWMRAKLHATSINALVADYDLYPFAPEGRNTSMRLVQGALRLSAHVLVCDSSQLPGQLLGRLGQLSQSELRNLCDHIVQYKDVPWLYPLKANLLPPGGPLLQTLTGHKAGVRAVAMTADGRRAISASHDQTLKVWNLVTGAEEATLRGHTDWVVAVAVTANGQRVVSASFDQTLKVWNLTTGAEEATLRGHTSQVWAVVVTTDGRRAVSASDDQTLKVWNLTTGAEEATLWGHTDRVNAVAVTADGRRAVSASDDRTLKVWNLAAGAEEATLWGHTALVCAVAVTADGRRAVSGSYDQTLKVWNLVTGAEEATLWGHSDHVIAVAVTADGQRAVSGSYDQTLKVWNLATGTEEATLRGHTSLVYAVAVTADGRRAVSASADQTLKVWNLTTGEEEATSRQHTAGANAVAVTADGQCAVSASADQTLKVWNLATRAEVARLWGHTDWIRAVAVTADGRRAVSGSYDQTLKVWNLATGTEEATLRGHTDRVNAVVVTADGRRAVSASDDQTIKVWNLTTGTEEAMLRGHTDRVNAVAVTADGRRAVSASDDRTLKVWNLTTGEEEATLRGHTDRVNAVAVTADGQHAVSASWDGMLKVWNLATRAEEVTLRGHMALVMAVAVMADGQHAISASLDQTLKVWNLKNGECVATFSADGTIETCAVASDGTIVAGDGLGCVHYLKVVEPGADVTHRG